MTSSSSEDPTPISGNIVVLENELAYPFVAGSITVSRLHDVFVGLCNARDDIGLAYATVFSPHSRALLVSALQYILGETTDIDASDVPFSARLSEIMRSSRLGDDVGKASLIEGAVGLIRLAYLELHAVELGVPAFHLAGTLGRGRIYLSGGPLNADLDTLAELELTARRLGTSVIKVKIAGPEVSVASERVRSILDRFPVDLCIAIDANQTFALEDARRLSEELETAAERIKWFEEPLSADDVESLRQLRDSSPIPIAAGETLFDGRLHAQLLTHNACDLLILNPIRVGGPETLFALRDSAAQRATSVLGHIYPHLSAHLLTSAGSDVMLEYMDWWDERFRPDAYRISDGMLYASPHVPGFGFAHRLREEFF